MAPRVIWAQVGGGTVRQGFRMGDRYLTAGTPLTGDDIRSIPTANRQSLYDAGKFDVYMQAPAGASATGGELDRHVIDRGGGKFDVVEGRQLNRHPLTAQEAYDLAGLPAPDHLLPKQPNGKGHGKIVPVPRARLARKNRTRRAGASA